MKLRDWFAYCESQNSKDPRERHRAYLDWCQLQTTESARARKRRKKRRGRTKPPFGGSYECGP